MNVGMWTRIEVFIGFLEWIHKVHFFERETYEAKNVVRGETD